ncbi:hypothetical protein [Luteimonas aquatica]|uniref:hypothetical protein n=1 Tax=Luteimonas aquatica TaxID=450364 RepID=UPI001F594CE2|nr:hypothetical protein [Luteimonas aquatica]
MTIDTPETLQRQLQTLQAQVADLQRRVPGGHGPAPVRLRGAAAAAVALTLLSWAAYSEPTAPELILPQQVARLEGRMETVEKQLRSGRFKAPFSIVDEKGLPILSVFSGGNRGVFVLNDASRPGAAAKGVVIEAGDRSGIRVRNDGQQAWIGEMDDEAMGVYVAGAGGERDIRSLMNLEDGFEVRDGHERVASLGVSAKGNPSLRLYSRTVGPNRPLAAIGVDAKSSEGGVEVRNPAGKLMARIGTVDNKGGIAAVYRTTETPVASIETEEGSNGGIVAVWNSGYNAIASLRQNNRGGTLELSDLTGEIMVDAFTTTKGTGMVRTGPSDRPGGLGMGLPGSFIMGKREGKGGGN